MENMQPMMNFGYNMQYGNEINGGYPYGYPPNYVPMNVMPPSPPPNQSMYSPFISPFPQPAPTQFIPNFNAGDIEAVDKNGNTVVLPSTEYNQGGARISQGGFNPITGINNPPIAGSGFNPFTKFIGNNGYGNPIQNPSAGAFTPYAPSATMNPYLMSPYFNNGYGQNQFDYQLQELLYNDQPSVIDARAMIEQVVLSDAEREKINHNRSYYIGTDYYGRPMYSNAYLESQQRQSQFEEARKAYQTYFTHLSKVAHAYSGETIDEESAMRHFDPVPPQPVQTQRVFNSYNSTEEEKKQYAREFVVRRALDLESEIANYDYRAKLMQQQKEMAFAQIKASHDKLIGVEPGQHYNLQTFLDNGYKIGVNIAMQAAKSANRNGTNKYSRNDYRGNISQETNAPVPITSKDDEYVSIEQMLKGVYDRNRLTNNIMKNSNGQSTFTSEPAFSSEYEAHQYFLQAMQNKKDIDDIRRAVK